MKFFARLFFKRRHEPTVASVALRRARNLFFGAFPFYDSFFSFAAAMAKEKAGIDTYAKHVCWRRRDRGVGIYLLFWLLTGL